MSMRTAQPRFPLGVASRIWDYIEEPKNVTLVQALVVYTAAVGGGIMTLLYPPRTTSVILGDGLMTFTAALMVFSGVIGWVTSVSGWWWIERTLAVGLLGLAGAAYTYSVIEAQVLSEGNRWMQLAWITIALGGLLVRYMRIRKANYDPVL